jgi:hypothetical protein
MVRGDHAHKNGQSENLVIPVLANCESHLFYFWVDTPKTHHLWFHQ